MSNGEKCYHCGCEETGHDHIAWMRAGDRDYTLDVITEMYGADQNQWPCNSFLSEVNHHPLCPVSAKLSTELEELYCQHLSHRQHGCRELMDRCGIDHRHH